MTEDLEEKPEFNSHVCVQEGDKYNFYTTKVSESKNLEFANHFLEEIL